MNITWKDWLRLGLAGAAIVLWFLLVPRVADAAEGTNAGFESANEAAVYALKSAYDKHPHYYEYGGIIVRTPNGKFGASRPMTEGHASDTEINEDNEAYEGSYPIVGDYHTHPCINGFVPGVFSPTDLKSARSYRLSTYILDECTGDVHYWEPGMPYDNTSLEPEEVLMGIQVAVGKIVGHIPVDGKGFDL